MNQQLTTQKDNAALREALKTSLYPGASDSAVEMVLAYCQAAGYDPMKKPVHIVPMKVSTGRKDNNGYDIKETRDVIMPGIGQYRTDAARTGAYAGCDEPEFGPLQTLEFDREKWVYVQGRDRKQKQIVPDSITYPEWCRVTVYKLVGGVTVKFTAKEYWLENYAEKGDDGAPNSMWEKRPFAQLAKCAEAQALRKAFPETVSSQATADEMEGKVIDVTPTRVQEPSPRAAIEQKPAELAVYDAEQFATKLEEWRTLIESGKATPDRILAMSATKVKLTDEQKAQISKLGQVDEPPPSHSDNPDFPLEDE